MLGASERTITVPESQFKIPLLCADQFDDVAAMRRLRADWRFQIWGVAPPDGRRFDAASALLESLVMSYAASVAKASPDVWVDHTPSNMQYATTLRSSFPEAAFVHIVRDVRGVAASLMRLDWGPTDARRAAEYWVQNIAYGLAVERSSIGPVVRIRYEDLVTNPRATIEELCETLGIAFAKDMVEGAGFTPPAYTVPIHELIGQPPKQARAEAWRSELTERQVELIESVTCDLLPLLGYTPEFGCDAKGRTPRETFASYFVNPTHRAVNKLRSRRRKNAAVRRVRDGQP